MTPEEALEQAGFALPEVNTPVANYVMAVRTGSLMFLSGHGAFDGGTPVHTGRLVRTWAPRMVATPRRR